jgi:hypothetical protein
MLKVLELSVFPFASTAYLTQCGHVFEGLWGDWAGLIPVPVLQCKQLFACLLSLMIILEM